MSFGTNVVKSSPDPEITAYIALAIRYVLFGLGVFGVTVGALKSSGSIEMLASAIAGIVAVGLALYNKFADYRHAHAVAQINAATPVASPPMQPERAGFFAK